jgi:cyclopropane fatty-acyl-phospholipid synthase-like methyltransferase
MTTTDEKLAKSLTADSLELIPYLPYLLQDIWQLGSLPKVVESLLSKHDAVSASGTILDLACGKGSVSVYLAQVYGCKVKGIDILPEFIDYARRKANECGVDNLCEFIVEDINVSVVKEREYDVVIFGAAGDVLGDRVETLLNLKGTIKPTGYCLIDDAYSMIHTDTRYPSREQWIKDIQSAGFELIDETTGDLLELKAINRFNQTCIEHRAEELKKKYPLTAEMFASYVRSQQAECDELENELICFTWLLKCIEIA